MAFSVNAVAPRDETKTRTFDLLGHKSEITYYPNRIVISDGVVAVTRPHGPHLEGESDRASAPDEDDEDEVRNQVAIELAYLVKDFDWEGPVITKDGDEVVGHGEPVPLDPEVLQHVPLVLLRAASDAIVQDAFPNSRADRRRRKR